VRTWPVVVVLVVAALGLWRRVRELERYRLSERMAYWVAL
jgi:hypothetical protein